MDLHTPRLVLVTLRADALEALIGGDLARAGELAGVRFPAVWPDSEEARDGLPFHREGLEAGEPPQWRIRLICEGPAREVIGSINLKGPPAPDGSVEFGWGLVEAARGRGLAREAAEAVLAWVFAQPGVTKVIATIPGHNPASEGVARAIGMARTTEHRKALEVWVVRPGRP